MVDKECNAPAPKIKVTPKPKATYKIIIETEYNKALRTPCDLVLLCFVKKLTFIGIIGKTHGVNKASAPPIKPAIKIAHHVFGVFTSVVSVSACLTFTLDGSAGICVAVSITESVFITLSLVAAATGVTVLVTAA